jgi:hypothetical protein
MIVFRQSQDIVFKNACNVTLPKSDEPRIHGSIRVVSFDIFIGGSVREKAHEGKSITFTRIFFG